MDLFRRGGRRRLQEDAPDAVQEGCHQAVWENTNPDLETTAENAVEVWMSYEEHFDTENFVPKEGKEEEALAYLNVVNDAGDEDIEVAYSVVENFVMGVFCPAANTDPNYLKLNYAAEAVPPSPPPIPEGVNLELGEGSLCPEMDDTGKRPGCGVSEAGENLCCGHSTNADASKKIDHCQLESTGAYEKDEDSWTFECYADSASKLIASLAAIVSIGFSYL